MFGSGPGNSRHKEVQGNTMVILSLYKIILQDLTPLAGILGAILPVECKHTNISIHLIQSNTLIQIHTDIYIF